MDFFAFLLVCWLVAWAIAIAVVVIEWAREPEATARRERAPLRRHGAAMRSEGPDAQEDCSARAGAAQAPGAWAAARSGPRRSRGTSHLSVYILGPLAVSGMALGAARGLFVRGGE